MSPRPDDPPRANEPQRPGYALPLLLAGAFRGLVEALHAQLAEQGHPEARPLHGFALQAVGPAGATPSELGRRLGVSKQAATKTAAALERLGYLHREAHPADARAVLLRRTARGDDLLARSAVIFAGLRAGLESELGRARVTALEDDLERIATATGARLGDLPGWLR
ncbi:MAG TPA: MarR family winged helix-turn-helix transcriptional regulator [Solirubrobacteraceae bacterium]|nr:MarR family winged helix-turn-helix transcriptional regulator [Solirubrobacteraceae bacterium]